MYRCIWLIQSYPALEGVPLGMHWQGILYSYKEGLRVPCQSIGIIPCTNRCSVYIYGLHYPATPALPKLPQ